jgi:isoquinoline 1-oxidoreductase subunit beta
MNPRMRAIVRAELGLDGDGAGLDRRGFLQVTATAAGGLLLAARFPSIADAAGAAAPGPQLYIAIAPDNRVTLTIPHSEIGQGVRTSLAMLIAEELDADWSQIRVDNAPFDRRFDDQGAGGSSSVWSRFDSLRQVGAAMRTMLIGAAAARWRVPAAQLRADNGFVVHAASRRRASFAELFADAARQPVPDNPPLRPRAQWKIIGKDHIGKDVDDIVHGRARFGLDQRLPGMLFASIERPREFGATPASFDRAAALAVPGVKHVIELAAVAPSVDMAHARITGGMPRTASRWYRCSGAPAPRWYTRLATPTPSSPAQRPCIAPTTASRSSPTPLSSR